MMKIPLKIIQIRRFILLCFTSLVLLSCAGRTDVKNSETISVNSNTTAVTATGDSIYYGKNILKYTINGRHVDIKDALKQGEGKYTTVLYVNKASIDGSTIKISVTNLITSEVFDLSFPATGGSARGSYLGIHGIIFYKSDDVKVQVMSLTTTHIAANFSGKFSTSDPTPGSIDVRDGSFDLLIKKK